MSHKHDVVLITGGGSGIGREAARRFARKGAVVILLDVNQPGMTETAAGFDNIHPYCVDITDYHAVCTAVTSAQEQHGDITRLYNCAAIMPFGKLLEQDNAIIHKQMAINYGGLVNITQAVLPGMVAREQGDFVSFSSMAGWIPMLKTGAYTATKFAVRAFTETLYHEHRDCGVRFACVCPPVVATPLLDQAKASDWPKMLEEQGDPMSPAQVLDDIERCLNQGKFMVLPSRNAKLGVLLRRFVPSLIWKQVHQVDG